MTSIEMGVTRVPDRFPGVEYCQGLVERYFGRDRCNTCRGCREWRDVAPFGRRPAPARPVVSSPSLSVTGKATARPL